MNFVLGRGWAGQNALHTSAQNTTATIFNSVSRPAKYNAEFRYLTCKIRGGRANHRVRGDDCTSEEKFLMFTEFLARLRYNSLKPQWTLISSLRFWKWLGKAVSRVPAKRFSGRSRLSVLRFVN